MKTLGLDIGTTTISAVVLWENTVLASRTVKNDSLLPGKSWERLQDPEAIRATALKIVEDLLREHGDVDAIGVTGQMHGILYLDVHGTPVSPLYTWQDRRGELLRDDGKTWARWLSETTGYALATGLGMVTHVYNVCHRLVPPEAVVFCTIADYLAMVLSGRCTPAVDSTNAASLGVYHSQRGEFDREALVRIGLDCAMLPTLAQEPILGVGSLGLPIAVALGDNQASFLGCVGSTTNTLLINMGTGGQISIFSPDYLETEALETRPFPGGGWLVVGASLAGGRSYALLEHFFRQVVEMVQGHCGSVYEAMSRALDQAGPVENSLHTTTTFLGTRKNPKLRGSFTQIGPDNFTPIHMMYGVMHGMAQELYTMFHSYLAAGGTAPTRMMGSGNGLQKNPHLCRVFEETFGYPMLLSTKNEEAACGAASYAASHVQAYLGTLPHL